MKNSLRDRAEAMLKGQAPTPALLRGPLALASALPRAAMAARRLKPVVRVPAHVVSFGNITLGGTGKTPAVIARAQAELASGRTVAIITRGHGAPNRVAEPFLAGIDEAARWENIGDEAALIKARVPGCVIVRSADRAAGARAAIERARCEVLLLDDGFQAVQLHRDENIVLIDATCPFGNRRVVPAGYLREPLAALRRATEIYLTRCDQAKDLQALEREIAGLAPGIPVWRTRHAPTSLVRLHDQAVLPLAALADREIAALCGIGNPGAFLSSLTALGATVADKHVVPDHAMLAGVSGTADRPLVMTEKDAVKLARPGEHDYALRIDFQIEAPMA